MLSVHLTSEDLVRIRIASTPALMWETTLSLHWLQRCVAGTAGELWRRSVAGKLPHSTELLATLIPPRGYIPDFLTPFGLAAELAEAMEPVLHVPKKRLRQELAELTADRLRSPWVRELSEGDGGALKRLGRAFHSYHRVAIAPFWEQVRRNVAQEHVRASHLMTESGIEALLTHLSPAVRWRRPVLEVDYPVDRPLRPAGRGLILIPSYFCDRRPITLVRHDTTPFLVYPLERRLLDGDCPPDPSKALADLVGQSRAAVLEAVDGTGNTSEIARRAGILVSSASQHLAVLRRAGLVASTRQGNSMIHNLTLTGASLLPGLGCRQHEEPGEKRPPPPPPRPGG
ncbi:ArsR/SmtB family transcription factor, partial [Amycolatopsis solani]|uniref:ArsR/SmtB family transcription factor n=1 Tax=Amycolatopsis solani TaxID=3028615 RepID=UPI0025B22A0A